jgi:hypothetical protein
MHLRFICLAHHYGLNWTLAMDAVFSAPAKAAGLDHRIGYAVEGHDADLVIWDSMPLSLGATPAQVWIDGVKQLKNPHVVTKPGQQDVPRSRPDSHRRAKETRETGGKLSYAPKKTLQDVVFVNVRSAFGLGQDGEVEQTFGAAYDSADSVDVAAALGSVVVRGSEIVCAGECDSFASGIVDVVDLLGGSLLPGLVGYGPALGVSEIAPEKSTVDGNTFDVVAPAAGVPEILKGTIIKGSEALSLGGKELQCVPLLDLRALLPCADLVSIAIAGSFTTPVSSRLSLTRLAPASFLASPRPSARAPRTSSRRVPSSPRLAPCTQLSPTAAPPAPSLSRSGRSSYSCSAAPQRTLRRPPTLPRQQRARSRLLLPLRRFVIAPSLTPS